MRAGRLACMAALLLGAQPARAHDADALWKIVHGHCVPDQASHRDPAPCAGVDPDGGVATLKDIQGASQYLLIPTARIAGIESPAILAPGAPNFFARAWEATALVDARLHRALPRRDFALAINSQEGRSQDQLHIHVDCIRPDIRAVLDQAAPGIGPHWAMLPMRLARHRYRAIWIPGDSLSDVNPFRLLAASLADPAREMGHHTLVLVGDTKGAQPGFVLLDGQAGWLSIGSGSGEELEDHACAIAG